MHPQAKKWRTKPFPIYDDVHFLVEGRYATGSAAYQGPVSGADDADSSDASSEIDWPKTDDEHSGVTQPESHEEAFNSVSAMVGIPSAVVTSL